MKGGEGEEQKSFFLLFNCYLFFMNVPPGHTRSASPTLFQPPPPIFIAISRTCLRNKCLYFIYYTYIKQCQINCLKRCLSLIQALYVISAIFFCERRTCLYYHERSYKGFLFRVVTIFEYDVFYISNSLYSYAFFTLLHLLERRDTAFFLFAFRYGQALIR